MCVAWELPHLLQVGILRKVFYDLIPIESGRQRTDKVNFIIICNVLQDRSSVTKKTNFKLRCSPKR